MARVLREAMMGVAKRLDGLEESVVQPDEIGYIMSRIVLPWLSKKIVWTGIGKEPEQSTTSLRSPTWEYGGVESTYQKGKVEATLRVNREQTPRRKITEMWSFSVYELNAPQVDSPSWKKYDLQVDEFEPLSRKERAALSIDKWNEIQRKDRRMLGRPRAERKLGSEDYLDKTRDGFKDWEKHARKEAKDFTKDLVAFIEKQDWPDDVHVRFVYGSQIEVYQKGLPASAKERRKKDQAEARKSGKFKWPDVKVGTIFVSNWGYDQTNIDYYEVTKLIGTSTIEVRAVQKKILSSGHGQDKVEPLKGKFKTGREADKGKIRLNGNSFKVPRTMSGHGYASIWDGTPDRQTAAGWGH